MLEDGFPIEAVLSDDSRIMLKNRMEVKEKVVNVDTNMVDSVVYFAE